MTIIYMVIILFTIIDFMHTKVIFTPIKIFNFVWIAVLFLYELKLSYIQQDFSDRTLLIFFLCIISYNIAAILFKMIIDKKNINKIKNEQQNVKIEEINLEKIIKIINIIFIVSFIIEIIYSKGIPLLWKLTGSPKTYLDFGIPSFHGMLNGFAACMGTYLLFRKKCKSKYIYIIYAVLIISRQLLITIFIQSIIYNILLKLKQGKKVNYKRYILIFIIILIVFTIIGNFRSSNVMEQNFKPTEKYENLSEGIMWIYSYVEFSFSNFNNLVSMTDGGVNYGASMFNFFLPTAVSNMLHIEEIYSPYYLVSPCFNVSTYLPEIYLDFGLLGIIAFNAIIGMIGTCLYIKVRDTEKIKWILMYSVFLHNVILLFFVNMFLYLSIMVQFAYIPILFSNKINNRKEKNENYVNKYNCTSI